MRAFFLSRALREKMLLVVFVALGAAIWASSVGERFAATTTAVRGTSTDLAEQQLWLERRLAIEEEAATAVANLDPSRTYNGVRLSAELSAIAGATGIGGSASSEGLRTERTPQFAVHTLQFTLRRVSWENLLQFYGRLSERAPYISIEQFSLAADRTNPALLNATLRVSSVEIAR
jgi:hypothetical protein